VAFVDRQVLNLLVDPIKNALSLTDSSFSLLQGLAFVAAYAVMGLVFGRLADQQSRRILLVLGVVIWSGFTVLCGLATGFWSFFGARSGIGAAEACLLPAGWSLLADYFDRDRLPRAMSLFLMGPFVGGGLALIFGGLLFRHLTVVAPTGIFANVAPWRMTFIAVGVPGVLVALMLLIMVREPPRKTASKIGDRHFTVRETLAFLWMGRHFYGPFFAGIALLIVGLYALPAWTPALLMRAHGAATAQVGLQYGSATLIAGSLGVLLGPWVSRRLHAAFPSDAPIRTAMVAGAGAAPACLFLAYAPTYWSALLASVTASCCLNIILPVAAAALQDSTPNRMRGLVTASYAFVLTATGLGVAPTLVALASDLVLGGPAKVGLALGWITGLAAIASFPLLIIAARHFPERVGAIVD
jgi:MFS transporter, Spinster family, sphingosine-1-phosphate transporter